MKFIKTITDKDLGMDFPKPLVYRERSAARAIVFDRENKIAFLRSDKKGYFKLPGGGVEEGEDFIIALKREMLEEIGCKINNIRDLGIIEEYRNDKGLHQLSHCFIADLDGEKGVPDFTEKEKEDNFEVIWIELEVAIKAVRNESRKEHYTGKFIHERDLCFLKEAKKIL